MDDSVNVAAGIIMIVFSILPVILIFVGFMGQRKVKKAKFYRRNGSGLELFDSYESMEVTKLKEGTLNLVSKGILILGFICIPVSCLLIASFMNMVSR